MILLRATISDNYTRQGYVAYAIKESDSFINEADYLSPTYRWGGKGRKIMSPMFFLHKPVFRKGDNTPKGFQLNIYSNSKSFRDRHWVALMLKLNAILGEPVKIVELKHYLCIVWNLDSENIPELEKTQFDPT